MNKRGVLPPECDLSEVIMELYDRFVTEEWKKLLDRILASPYANSPTAGDAEWAVRKSAAMRAMRGTLLSWEKIRQIVYERDAGVCNVCGGFVEWRHYECGHIIEKFLCGVDHPSNLVVMHVICNRLKPVHRTRGEYLAWVRCGAWMAKLANEVAEGMSKEEIRELERQEGVPISALISSFVADPLG